MNTENIAIQKNKSFIEENKALLEADIECNIIDFIYKLPFDYVEKITGFNKHIRTFAMGMKVIDNEKENFFRFHRIIKKMQDVIMSSYVIATHQKLEDDSFFEQRPVKFILRKAPEIICHNGYDCGDDCIIVLARFGATQFIPEEESNNV